MSEYPARSPLKPDPMLASPALNVYGGNKDTDMDMYRTITTGTGVSLAIAACLVTAGFLPGQVIQGAGGGFPDMYNVAWESQSENAAGSMPVGGGDVGLNVWVEGNQLLCYLQRSGIHDELNGFPKLGRTTKDVRS